MLSGDFREPSASTAQPGSDMVRKTMRRMSVNSQVFGRIYTYVLSHSGTTFDGQCHRQEKIIPGAAWFEHR